MKKLIGTLTLMTTVLASSIVSYGAINEYAILDNDYSWGAVENEWDKDPNKMTTFGGKIYYNVFKTDWTLPQRNDIANLTGADKTIKAISDKVLDSYCKSAFQMRISGITEGAFENCTELEYADLRLCRNIENRAFANCTSLKDVYLISSTDIAPDAFNGCDKNKLVFHFNEAAKEVNIRPALDFVKDNGFKYVFNPDIIVGDVDNDGVVTSVDAAKLHQFILNYKNDYSRYYIYDNFDYIDVDNDGKITSSDVANILQKSLDSSYKMPRDR